MIAVEMIGHEFRPGKGNLPRIKAVSWYGRQQVIEFACRFTINVEIFASYLRL
jgi:hypothetical protein